MNRDYDFWIPDEQTFQNQLNNKKAIRNYRETVKLLHSHSGLWGDVLDIGTRNCVTLQLEIDFHIDKIHSTIGDLDERFEHPLYEYDFVHYNNVIEHQFNPLFTLLNIRKVLKPQGLLILGTPLKPNWITWATCHFHEFDEYRYRKLIERAGFEVVKEVRYYHQFGIGLRGFFGMFCTRQVISILKKI